MRAIKNVIVTSAIAILIAALALKARTSTLPAADDATYDIVIANGRVMDP